MEEADQKLVIYLSQIIEDAKVDWYEQFEDNAQDRES